MKTKNKKSSSPSSSAKKAAWLKKQRALRLNSPAKKAARVRITKTPHKQMAKVAGAIKKSKVKLAPVEKSHAKHSPSSLKNKEICPGFMSRDTVSDASAEGSMLHKFMEDWGKAYWLRLKNQHKGIGTSVKLFTNLDRQFAAFTMEQQEIIATLQTVMATLFGKYADGTALFEYEFDLSSYNLPGCEHGTVDVVLVNKVMTRFCIVDYKFGKNEVDDPEENVQFTTYALGAFAKYPKAEAGDVKCLQPRCDVIGDATFTRADIPELQLRAKVITERAEVADPATFNPQAGLCQFCDRIGTCEAVNNFALKVTHKLDLPKSLDPEKHADDPQALGTLMTWSKILEEKGKAMQKGIVGLAADDHDVDGFILINSSGKKSLIDGLGLAEELKAKFGVKAEQFISCSTVSTEKLHDVLAKMTEPDDRAARAKELDKLIDDGGYFLEGPGFSYMKKSSR